MAVEARMVVVGGTPLQQARYGMDNMYLTSLMLQRLNIFFIHIF